MPTVKEIHEKTLKKIDQGVPGYAQADIDGQLVSWHRGVFNASTYTGTVGPGETVTSVRNSFLDLWVKGKAIVSPHTFTKDQLNARADQWKTGNGVPNGSPDAAFAKLMRNFALSHN